LGARLIARNYIRPETPTASTEDERPEPAEASEVDADPADPS
jgi:hypothetical protein